LYDIRTTREILAPSFEDAVEAARQIGYPVALEAESSALLHRSEAGAVMLGIADDAALKRGFKRALANAWATVPWDSIDGILVQEMIAPGTEIVIRMTNEPPRGVVITCGLGDIVVEAFRGSDLVLPPVTDAEARTALADVLLRLSELCNDLGDLVRELVVDPLIVAETGGDVCAVDCWIVPND